LAKRKVQAAFLPWLRIASPEAPRNAIQYRDNKYISCNNVEQRSINLDWCEHLITKHFTVHEV